MGDLSECEEGDPVPRLLRAEAVPCGDGQSNGTGTAEDSCLIPTGTVFDCVQYCRRLQSSRSNYTPRGFERLDCMARQHWRLIVTWE
eukprot:scaffold2086_cov114-Skeletonema_marinoi.AAC.1